MNALDYHRGVGFSVVQIGGDRWQWAIHPPKDVKEFKTVSGQLSGTRNDAVEAAKREIDKQDTGTT